MFLRLAWILGKVYPINFINRVRFIPSFLPILPFPVFLDSMNFHQTIYIFTSRATISLLKIPTNPKIINPVKSSIKYIGEIDFIPQRDSLGFYLSKSIRSNASNYAETTSNRKVIIKSYQNDGFVEIRQKYLNSIDFQKSVSTFQPFDITGGKKCKEFYKTNDDRFILKKMTCL